MSSSVCPCPFLRHSERGKLLAGTAKKGPAHCDCAGRAKRSWARRQKQQDERPAGSVLLLLLLRMVAEEEMVMAVVLVCRTPLDEAPPDTAHAVRGAGGRRRRR